MIFIEDSLWEHNCIRMNSKKEFGMSERERDREMLSIQDLHMVCAQFN